MTIILHFVLIAQTLSSTPVPIIKAETGVTRTLADVARERKLGKKGVVGGTLSVAGTPGAPLLAGGSSDKAATEADARLAKAIRDGAWVDRNIHYNEDIREQARREWDAATENCRRTPGCTPTYRDGVEFHTKPLRTSDETMRDEVKKNGSYDSVEPLSH